MCKHKSGGMSKPSETNTSNGISERPTASMSSQSTIEVPASQDSDDTAMSEPSCSTTMMYAAAANPPVYATGNRLCDTYNFHPTETLYSNQYEGMSFMPNIKETQQELFESQDSDDDSEQSPMLIKDADILYCNAQEQWSSTNEESNNNPNHYNLHDVYSYSNIETRGKALNCDNFLAYRNYNPQPTMLPDAPPYMPSPHCGDVTCPSYFETTINTYKGLKMTDFSPSNHLTRPKKKWLVNQKCKSADSDPDSIMNYSSTAFKKNDISLVNYNYVPGQSTNALETHNSRHNPYLKSMYVRNDDPIAGPSGLQRPCSINWDAGVNNTDGEFRSRSYSLTPTVNFAVFETESSSEAEDIQVPEPVHEMEANSKTIDDIFEFHNMPCGKMIPISPSAAQLSIASSYGDNGSPICKICHMTGKENDPLISPCRCSGTMQYIHCGCLMRWLEVCHKRGRRPASCELCQYQYHWHKKFKVRHWQFPPCSRKDKILHLLFILSALLMMSCAALTVVFFKHDKGTKIDMNQELSESEIGNLVCGVLFFVAFFVAIYVEAKSHDTLYKLLVKFIHINQQWYIDEYEKKETPPVAV